MLETLRAHLSTLSRRQWVLIGALFLCAVCGAYLLGADADAPVVIVQHSETTPPPSLEITGLAAAAKRTALRNPFSETHERMGESPPAAVPESVKGTAAAPPSLSVPVSPVQQAVAASSAPPPAPLVLRGVVTGADGTRIAILAQGADGAALAAGETWHGYTLRTLTERTAILDSAAGTSTLTRE